MGWGSGTPADHPYPKSWQVTPPVDFTNSMTLIPNLTFTNFRKVFIFISSIPLYFSILLFIHEDFNSEKFLATRTCTGRIQRYKLLAIHPGQPTRLRHVGGDGSRGLELQGCASILHQIRKHSNSRAEKIRFILTFYVITSLPKCLQRSYHE